MLKLAVLFGVLSYLILALGILNILYPSLVLTVLLIWLMFLAFLFKKQIRSFSFKNFRKVNTDKKDRFLFAILFVLVLINLIGVFGPETSFDSLWYHLTIPKIFILHHSVYFISGNLFYYSLMPKLTEMLYIIPLILGNEIGAKILQFIFGILILYVLYKISRFYLSHRLSLLSVIVFYSNLVVSWLTISSYIDMTRTFYEVIAFLYFLIYIKTSRNIYFYLSAVLLGFAICTKYFSIESIAIFCLLIFFIPRITFFEKVKKSFLFVLVSISVSLPWFLISFFYTKNPFYPLFTVISSSQYSLSFLNPVSFIKYFINIFLFASDPINPVYFIFLPIIILNFKKIFLKYRFVTVYSIGAIIVWYITPHDGGSRFLIPFLPVLSVLALLSLSLIKGDLKKKILIYAIILVSISTIAYRSLANFKYVPVELGFETKSDFLMKNLNFSFGDFYDENGEIKKIVNSKKVLLLGMHNLYYVDFPFTLSEWKDAKSAKYMLVQGGVLNEKYSSRKAIYKNDKTHVTLYKL
jgi:hypothetical protein